MQDAPMLILVILLFFRCMPSTGSDRFVGGTDLWNNRLSAPPRGLRGAMRP